MWNLEQFASRRSNNKPKIIIKVKAIVKKSKMHIHISTHTHTTQYLCIFIKYTELKITIFSHMLNASIAKHLSHHRCCWNIKWLCHSLHMVHYWIRAICILHICILQFLLCHYASSQQKKTPLNFNSAYNCTFQTIFLFWFVNLIFFILHIQ